MRKQTKVIDAQVHAYERDHPERPWAGTLQGPDEVTGNDMVEAMDAVRVDGALLVSPYSMYRFDPSYALEVSRQYPGRLGLIRPLDPNSKDLDEQMVEWARHPGVVGARIMLNSNPTESSPPVWTSEHHGLNSILRSASKHNLPVNLLGWGGLDLVGDLAKRNPNTQVVLDHLGLPQPFVPPPPAIGNFRMHSGQILDSLGSRAAAPRNCLNPDRGQRCSGRFLPDTRRTVTGLGPPPRTLPLCRRALPCRLSPIGRRYNPENTRGG